MQMVTGCCRWQRFVSLGLQWSPNWHKSVGILNRDFQLRIQNDRGFLNHWLRRHRPETGTTPTAYTKIVDNWQNPNEDSRGVDVGQIRDMLSMSVAERAHEMVRVANLMAKARETAREARLGTR